VKAARSSPSGIAEQLRAQFFDRFHDEGTIEEVVLLFATCLGRQDAAMAGRAV
jgi:hypothetical protein